MALTTEQTEIKEQLLAICPEANKISDASVDIHVVDGNIEAAEIFVDGKVIRASRDLAAHFCALQYYSLITVAGDTGSADDGAGSEVTINAGLESEEIFDMKKTYGSSVTMTSGIRDLIKTASRLLGKDAAPYATTFYGQKYLQMVAMYATVVPVIHFNEQPVSPWRR